MTRVVGGPASQKGNGVKVNLQGAESAAWIPAGRPQSLFCLSLGRDARIGGITGEGLISGMGTAVAWRENPL